MISDKIEIIVDDVSYYPDNMEPMDVKTNQYVSFEKKDKMKPHELIISVGYIPNFEYLKEIEFTQLNATYILTDVLWIIMMYVNNTKKLQSIKLNIPYEVNCETEHLFNEFSGAGFSFEMKDKQIIVTKK